MDRNKFSAIAYRNHVFSNPINEAKLMKALQFLTLSPGDRVVDAGAGKCELLIRLIEQYQVKATAIEYDAGAIEEAKRRASGRIPEGHLTFVNQDAKQAIDSLANREYALGICIGSTHALGGVSEALSALKKCVKQGGYILIGAGYWKQKPSQDYLLALGTTESDLHTHEENVKAGEDLGLIPLWSIVSSDDDWDEYEWLYSMSIENYCYEHPEDPDCPAMLARIRTWRRTYLKWGRDTLGFALYLFRSRG
ncbi:class I SAM-dependent methyltransferase [Brevibacillus sp. SYP-B805]|uniref:SAM-dependent methyltransferase n=1 Tax=Brevibacillus sp. SYP-B805 TaxID=1578199 RepID=UPI0013E9E3D3|nr:class I SAM-dependent methyltransferase [Brevibacillus sp. SYP-B805]NGQ95404.1 class I SAM-dependent methyltransferase [Brevibacillus sp. SYP-B805]